MSEEHEVNLQKAIKRILRGTNPSSCSITWDENGHVIITTNTRPHDAGKGVRGE